MRDNDSLIKLEKSYHRLKRALGWKDIPAVEEAKDQLIETVKGVRVHDKE